MKEAHRVRAQAEYERAQHRSKTISPEEHQAALMRRQGAMAARAHFDRQQALRAQQMANTGPLYGFSDPRATYAAQQSQNNFLSDTVNALMMQQMLNSGTVVTKSHYDNDTATVVTKVIPVEHLYREPDPEPQRSYSSDTSSSSSSSSDTSSDSYGGSDTSSDSF
jgi:hypothetical protein